MLMTGGIGNLLGGGRERRKRGEEESRRREVEESRRKQERDARNLVAGQIEHDLYNALKNKDKDERLRFICKDDLLRIWTFPRIEQLSKGLDWATSDMLGLAQESFVKVLSILIWIHWDHWNEFGRLFLKHADHRKDKKLPLKDTSFLQTELLQASFRDQQYIFIPVIIKEDDEEEEEDIQYSEKHRMPFLNTKGIGQGGSGLVTEEEIPPHYFMYKNGVLNPTPLLVARKRIPRVRTGFSRENWNFSTEQKSLKSFKRCLEGNRNIMLSLTSFSHGPNFTIISPLADLDLHTFFEGDYGDFRTRSLGFTPAHLLHGACCLAGALRFLHEGLQPVGIAGKLYCAHLDFKPENILVMWKGKDEPVGRWLVHDFGTSKIKEQSSAPTLAPGDFLRQFSLTQPQRAPGPFQAPEVQRLDERVVGRESDIWSLGCVVAVVLAFAHGGPPAVTQLAESRYRQSGCSDDYFYMKKGTEAILKDKTVKWLNNLYTGRREEAWISQTLRLIFKTLVEQPGARPSARTVQDILRNICYDEFDSLRDVCSWVPVELPCFPAGTPSPPAEAPVGMPRARVEVSRVATERILGQPEVYSGPEVVTNLEALLPGSSTGPYSPLSSPGSIRTGFPEASTTSVSGSSSNSSKAVNLTDDAKFMKYEIPRDTFRTAMCPSACHVAFLSKKCAAIMLLGDEGSWTTRHRPPSTNASSWTISCPDNWEWDFICLSGQYLILRSRKPKGRERKIYRYKCDMESGRIWTEEPLLGSGGLLHNIVSDALDMVLSCNGDVLFICDAHLWYYSSQYGLLPQLATQGQHRMASACFSPDGRWVYGWSHETGINYFYKWDTTDWVRCSDVNTTRTLRRQWEISMTYNTPQRLGTGLYALFPFSHYFVAFELPDRVYTIGKVESRPGVFQVSKPVRDVVAGVSFQGMEGGERVESLILLQGSEPGSLVTLPILRDVTGPPSTAYQLQYSFVKKYDGFAVLERDFKVYVVVSHTNGKLERRRMSST